MEYSVKSVAPIIESNYQNFTTVERTIADFFLQNQTQGDFSAKSVAERLFVSEASLSRFAKKCGYRGYREFLYQYEQYLGEREHHPMTEHTRMALDAYQELLNKTYSLLNEPQIARICGYLSESARVFVCGLGSSGLAAREMEMRFMRIGVNICSIADGDLMRMRAVFQNPASVVVGLSISAMTEDVLYFLRESHKNGAKTILITAWNRAGCEEFCDEVVLVPSLDHLNAGNVISPQFPILVMIDAIYAHYVEQDKLESEIWHDDTLKALGQERF